MSTTYNGQKSRLRIQVCGFQKENRYVHQFVLVYVSLQEERRSKYILLKSMSNKKCVQRKTVFMF